MTTREIHRQMNKDTCTGPILHMLNTNKVVRFSGVMFNFAHFFLSILTSRHSSLLNGLLKEHYLFYNVSFLCHSAHIVAGFGI